MAARKKAASASPTATASGRARVTARKKTASRRSAARTKKTTHPDGSDDVAKQDKDDKKKRKGGKKGKKATWLKRAKNVSDDDVRAVIDAGVGKADELLDHAFGWVTHMARQAMALYEMLVAWWRGKFEFPKATVGAITLALLYFVSPFDIMPDVLPVLGLVDDAAVLAFVTKMVQGDLRRYAKKFNVPLKDLGLDKA
jgi:uncharacterized membrane protein YkvA (DUF1232 family)